MSSTTTSSSTYIAPAQTRPAARAVGGLGLAALLLTGVIWPAVTVAVESVTRMCANQFFDPIPTPGHLLLALLVPLANLTLIVALARGVTRPRWGLGVLNGV